MKHNRKQVIQMRSNAHVSSQPKQGFHMETLKRLLSYMKQYKGLFVVVVICIIVSSVATAASSLFLQTLIDDYIMPLVAMEQPIYQELLKALCLIGMVYLIGTLATLFYNRFMVMIAQGMLNQIRDEMFLKMQELPISYFDTHTHGDIMSHYTNDTDTLKQMIAQSLAQLLASLCTIVAIFCCMLYQSIYLTIVVILALVLAMNIIKMIAMKSGSYFISQQTTLGDLDGYIEEMINGQKVIKVFCHEDVAIQDFKTKNETWQQHSSKANGYANMMMPFMNALGYLQYVIVAILGAWMAIQQVQNLTIFGMDTITLGVLVSFLTLTRSFNNPISQVSNQLNAIITALAGASRIFELMDEKPEYDEGYITLVPIVENAGLIEEVADKSGTYAWKHIQVDGSVTYTKLEGRIEFQHVDFSYSKNKKILSDISLYAKPGQKVAFVGATGAGKTTITNLINRFYDIDHGMIYYDGIDIRTIKKGDLRRSLGVILQDVNLFTGTIMDNLRYGNPSASNEDCVAAAKLVHAHDFIMMLPQGYHTVLKGDGSGLSQGQRQLLSIARAAVLDPPVMIMDEATSSIDTRTEAIVQRGMDRLMEGRTVFVIAHRLSTVRNADVIMVLDHGEIIERGTHESLMAKKGSYYQLSTGAFELE